MLVDVRKLVINIVAELLNRVKTEIVSKKDIFNGEVEKINAMNEELKKDKLNG